MFARLVPFLVLLAGCSLLDSEDVVPGEGAAGAGGGTVTSSSVSTGGSMASTGGSMAASGGSMAASGGASSSSAGGGCNLPAALFLDTFERPDDTALGNGWKEKNPNAFVLDAGRALKTATETRWSANLCYQSTLYDDVWVTADFVLSPPGGGPMVLARLDPAAIVPTDHFDGYGLFISSGSGYLWLVRNILPEGLFPQTLEAVEVANGFEFGASYRLQLRVSGSIPVALEGHVFKLVGSNWVSQASLSFDDSDPERFDGPGYVGFTESKGAGTTYDNFRVDAAM